MSGKTISLKFAPDVIVWSRAGDHKHAVRVKAELRCTICYVKAVVALPHWLVDEQPDGTTHVCHPLLGGCNHGFEMRERAMVHCPLCSSSFQGEGPTKEAALADAEASLANHKCGGAR